MVWSNGLFVVDPHRQQLPRLIRFTLENVNLFNQQVEQVFAVMQQKKSLIQPQAKSDYGHKDYFKPEMEKTGR